MVIYEKYLNIYSEFKEKSGNQDTVLFAILKMDDLVDSWSILISANWIDSVNRKIVLNDLINILQKNLSNEELSEIARIGFLKPEDHLVELFLENFKEGEHIKEDSQINGNVIHEGYIVALNKNAASHSQQRLFMEK